MLDVSSTLLGGGFAGAGMFSLGLGVVHVAIPVIVRFGRAIGDDADRPPLGVIGVGRATYALRRTDLIGLTWVMSNAASYVLISIGVVDLAWAAGMNVVPIRPVAVWIAGWWALRAAGQLAIGRRPGDWVVVAWLFVLAAVHAASIAVIPA